MMDLATALLSIPSGLIEAHAPRKRTTPDWLPAYQQKMRDTKRKQSALMVEQRLPIVLDRIRKERSGSTVSKKSYIAEIGFTTGIREGFAAAVESGLLVVVSRGTHFRYVRTEKK